MFGAVAAAKPYIQELVGPKLQSYRLQHGMWLAPSLLLQQVHDELKQ